MVKTNTNDALQEEAEKQKSAEEGKKDDNEINAISKGEIEPNESSQKGKDQDNSKLEMIK